MLPQVFLLSALLSATPAQSCRDISDDVKRSFFKDPSPILVDVDRDGRLDQILPRIYSSKLDPSELVGGYGAKQAHWISFDLVPADGRRKRSFFRYQYGTDVSRYWVYAMVPCDANNDKKIDLMFYAGDDTSDEMILLLNRGGKFVVHSRETSESE